MGAGRHIQNAVIKIRAYFCVGVTLQEASRETTRHARHSEQGRVNALNYRSLS